MANAPLINAIAQGWRLVVNEDGSHGFEPVPAAAQVAAFKAQAELGTGGKADVEEVKRCLSAQVALIQSRETWTRGELLAALAEVWGG